MAAASVAERSHTQDVADFENMLDSFFKTSDPNQEAAQALAAFATDQPVALAAAVGEPYAKAEPAGSGSNVSSNLTETHSAEMSVSALAAQDGWKDTQMYDTSVIPTVSPPAQDAPVAFTKDMLDFLNGTGALVSFPSQQTPGASLYAFNSQPTAVETKPEPGKAEKSRSAQRRFRERRKEQLGALQDKMEAMSVQMQALSVTNNELKQRSRVLQRLLKVQEEHKRVLEADYDGSSHCHPNVCTLEMEPHPEFSRLEILQQVCPTLALLARSKEDVNNARKMAPEQFIERWKKYLQDVSVHLLNSDADPANQDIVHDMSILTCDVTWMCKHLCVLNAGTMDRVACFDLERAAPATPDAQHWASVVQLIGFTPQQTADMTTALQLFRQRLAKIAVEMQDVTTAAAALGYNAPDHSSTWNPNAEADVKLVHRLEAVLQRQHEALLHIKGFFFGATVTCLQFARTAVYSYPFFPNALAIMEAATGVSVAAPTPQATGGQAPLQLDGAAGLQANGSHLQVPVLMQLSS